MAEVHPLCCHCDECLNGSGGLVPPNAGGTTPTPRDKPPSQRGLSLNQRLALALRRESAAEVALRRARRSVLELRAQGGER